MGIRLSVAAFLAAAGRPVAPPPPSLMGKVPVVSARVAASNFILNVSPATIAFNATNPDVAPVVSGGASAAVTWRNRSGNPGAWSLNVGADAASFINCPFVPVSAVTVSCISAATNLGRSAHCSPPFTLSRTPQVVAGGNQAASTNSYSVTIGFTLADNWKYIAETSPACSLSLSYTANVP